MRLSASCTGRLYPQEIFLVLIFTRDWVEPRAMVRSEGTMSLKNPVTPPGIDPGTVRLVAQRLNHYATPGPHCRNTSLSSHLADYVAIRRSINYRRCINVSAVTKWPLKKWYRGNYKTAEPADRIFKVGLSGVWVLKKTASYLSLLSGKRIKKNNPQKTYKCASFVLIFGSKYFRDIGAPFNHLATLLQSKLTGSSNNQRHFTKLHVCRDV